MSTDLTVRVVRMARGAWIWERWHGERRVWVARKHHARTERQARQLGRRAAARMRAR